MPAQPPDRLAATNGAPDAHAGTSAARRERLAAAIDRDWPYLEAFTLDLHAHPELMFEERRSAAKLTASLRDAGFAVEAGSGGIETAFVARHRFGPGGPRIALLAEYDALPELGHACGHNLIATAALGAGRALRNALEATGGELLVIGCPAEEGGGGKILLLQAGVFEGVSAHTPEFAAASANPAGLRGLRLATVALAATAADLLTDPELLAAARADFAAPGSPGGTP